MGVPLRKRRRYNYSKSTKCCESGITSSQLAMDKFQAPDMCVDGVGPRVADTSTSNAEIKLSLGKDTRIASRVVKTLNKPGVPLRKRRFQEWKIKCSSSCVVPVPKYEPTFTTIRHRRGTDSGRCFTLQL